MHEGESIKALSEYLGHLDPGFTLRPYTHVVGDSSQRVKRAIDSVFGHAPADDEPADTNEDDQERAQDDALDLENPEDDDES